MKWVNKNGNTNAVNPLMYIFTLHIVYSLVKRDSYG